MVYFYYVVSLTSHRESRIPQTRQPQRRGGLKAPPLMQSGMLEQDAGEADMCCNPQAIRHLRFLRQMW